MLKVIGKLKIQCKNCKKIHEFFPELECIDTFERNMGTEYEMESINEFSCDECGEDLYVRIEAWEYPEGCVNSVKYEKENVDICKEADIEAFTS